LEPDPKTIKEEYVWRLVINRFLGAISKVPNEKKGGVGMVNRDYRGTMTWKTYLN